MMSIRTTIRASLFFIILLVAMLAAFPVMADVLLIDSVNDAQHRDLPRTGLLKNNVREEWGQPLEERAAVGQPPITRWIYRDFSVYFEYDHVISSVLHEGAVLDEGGRL